jgi:hypothetical protein
MQTAQNFTVLKYKNNLLQKILFWQCVFTLVLLVAFGIKFYEKYQEGLQFTHKKYHKWAIINRTSDKTYRIVNLNEFNKDPTSPKWLDSCAYSSYDTLLCGFGQNKLKSQSTDLIVAIKKEREGNLINKNGDVILKFKDTIIYLPPQTGDSTNKGIIIHGDSVYHYSGDSVFFERSGEIELLEQKNGSVLKIASTEYKIGSDGKLQNNN